jgi:hypothetical protein
MSPNSKISIISAQNRERYGTLNSAADLSFSFHDIDDKTDLTLSYEDVAKVRAGYGGYNSVTHRHTDHTHALIIGGIVVAGLIGLIVIAAAHS